MATWGLTGKILPHSLRGRCELDVPGDLYSEPCIRSGPLLAALYYECRTPWPAAFIYVGKQGACLYIGLWSRMHGAKNGDKNRLTMEPCVASKAQQAVACCVYMAHGLDLQAQQAHTCLTMSV